MRKKMAFLVVSGWMMAAGPAAADEVTTSGAVVGEPSDPNYTRLLFGPTARPLRRGEGYLADHELLFPGIAYGLTNNISLAGGLSVIPGLGLSEQVFYLSPKVGFNLGESASVAVGALVAGGNGGGVGSESVRIGFAVGTFGSPRNSFTAGVGIGGTSSSFSDAMPIVMLGGTRTLSRHVALVGETWMFLDQDFQLDQQPVGVGVRLFNDRLSADLGVILTGALIDEGFPMPWVSVSYHFGPRAKRSGTQRPGFAASPRAGGRVQRSAAR